MLVHVSDWRQERRSETETMGFYWLEWHIIEVVISYTLQTKNHEE